MTRTTPVVLPTDYDRVIELYLAECREHGRTQANLLFANDEVEELRKRLSEAPPKWVSTSERLPGSDGVLLRDAAGRMSVGFYRHGDQTLGAWGWCAQYPHDLITHWMPLPEAPK